MEKVRKAVIPAAGLGTRFLPATKALPKEMLPIVDIPTIQYIVEEAIQSGIEEIVIITNPHKVELQNHFNDSKELVELLYKTNKIAEAELCEKIARMCKISYVMQYEQKGLGHAILCAEDFIKNEPFAVLLGDDVMYSDDIPVLKQCIDAFEKVHSCVVGCQKVEHKNVCKYGIVDPLPALSCDDRLYPCKGMVEKPDIDHAPSDLAVLGRYILTADIFHYLKTQVPGKGGEIQLTDAIVRCGQNNPIYAYDFEGKRYDVGDKFGFIQAQIDFALRRAEFVEPVKNYILQLAETLKK